MRSLMKELKSYFCDLSGVINKATDLFSSVSFPHREA